MSEHLRKNEFATSLGCLLTTFLPNFIHAKTSVTVWSAFFHCLQKCLPFHISHVSLCCCYARTPLISAFLIKYVEKKIIFMAIHCSELHVYTTCRYCSWTLSFKWAFLTQCVASNVSMAWPRFTTRLITLVFPPFSNVKMSRKQF